MLTGTYIWTISYILISGLFSLAWILKTHVVYVLMSQQGMILLNTILVFCVIFVPFSSPVCPPSLSA